MGFLFFFPFVDTSNLFSCLKVVCRKIPLIYGMKIFFPCFHVISCPFGWRRLAYGTSQTSYSSFWVGVVLNLLNFYIAIVCRNSNWLSIVWFCASKQVPHIVDEQVDVVSQATKPKAKGGKKIKKLANKVTLKPLEDPITFVPPLPISLPHMGQLPPTPHVGMQAQNHPYPSLPLISHDRRSTFDMKVIPIHFIEMLDDTN